MTARTLRTSLAVLAAVALSLPAAAHAQSRRTSTRYDGQDGGLKLGLNIGPEFAEGDTGIALRGDAEMALTHLAPNVRLDGLLSLGYTHFSYGAFTQDFSVNLVRLVPAARFVFPVAPQVSVYGDAGLGLYFGSASAGRFRASESLVGVNMRFAGGVLFDVNRNVSLGAELGLNPYFGDVDETTTTLMFALQFRP